MMDYKPSDTPLRIGQKFTKEMGPKDICEIDLMKTMPCAKVFGCLMYAMINIHLNLVFAVVQVAQFMTNPILAHWIAIKHIFCYIQATKDMGIIYGGESSQQYMLKIQGWTNCNWVGDQNSYKSTSRYIFLFAGGAISWQCKKQAIVAFSSIKVKYIALALATKEVVWLAQSMKDLGLP